MTTAPDDNQPEPAQPPAGSGRPGPAVGWLAGEDGLGGCLTGEEIAELSRQDWDPADADLWCEDPGGRAAGAARR